MMGVRGDAAQLAETGQRHRRSRQLIARRLVGARRLTDTANLGRNVTQRALFDVADDRYLQTIRRLGCDAEVQWR